MGCGQSKIDDLPAVNLCRQRCRFLEEAVHQRFLLAEAHVTYTHSLLKVGDCLHRFIDQNSHSSFDEPLSSPELNLPPRRKGDPVVERPSSSSPKKPAQPNLPVHSRSNSNSGSHLNLRSGSDDDSEDSEDDDDEVLHRHHSNHASTSRNYSGSGGGGGVYGNYTSTYVNNNGFHDFYKGGEGVGFFNVNYLKKEPTPSVVVYEESPLTLGIVKIDNDSPDLYKGGGMLHMNYMKNNAGPPSVVYEQRPMMSQTVRFGEASPSGYYYPNSPYRPGPSVPYSYYGYQDYGGTRGGLFGSPLNSGASTSKPPPPPPSPPTASAWDFLNPFDGYDNYYSAYTPSRDSREVREEEGIPDLEDEDCEHEVVKEVDGVNKFTAAVVNNGVADGSGNCSKSVMVDDGDGKAVGDEAEASLYESRPSASMESDGVEYEVHVIDKKVVHDKRSGEGKNAGLKIGSRSVSDAAVEIKIQFRRASESGNDIARLLEVGKFHYNRKYVSKMLHGVTPSLSVIALQPSASKNGDFLLATGNADPPALEIDEDLAVRSRKLSSTLQKLYLWEKKLYNEVKAEEKMRLVHERKYRKLKHLNERGAEVQKLDATRTLVRSLSTKIRMAIQVVDKISVTVNKIRDEELWPQLNELIHGLARMWRSMLECYQNQCLAIREARGLGSLGSGKKLGDTDLDVTLQLEHEVINWTSCFSSWIGAQKGYVRALNNWLVKCLWYEPEETPNGIVPLSPGRIGAPPVFVICNQWARALDRISEKEVLEAMRVFTTTVFDRWEQDKVEMRQRMMANKDLEGQVRDLDREDQKIQKEIQALDKKIVLVAGDNSVPLSGNIIYQSDTHSSSLERSLLRIFEAMERFTADTVKAYEELIQRSEEERSAQRHERAS